MADFHVRLALDYFQAKSTPERTEVARLGLIQHLADTYVLPCAERHRVYAAAVACVRRCGWLQEAV
jgi:hypothetical protein